MTFVAMLRGINVSGHNPLKMEALRTSLAALGLTDVRTYVQSGNAVFTAKSGAGLEKKIEAKLLSDFGYEVPVVVRSADELAVVVRANPFVKKGLDPTKLHVTFLSAPPPKAGLAKLAAVKAGDDLHVVKGTELYLYTPGGYGVSKLANTTIERLLGVRATTRNWKTTTTLAEMAGAAAP